MVRIIFLLIFLSISLNSKSEELNNQEKLFFSFIDLNNDKNIDTIVDLILFLNKINLDLLNIF